VSDSLAAIDLILTCVNALKKLELRKQLLIFGDGEQYSSAPALLGDNQWPLVR
jgi:hypothetical protein